MPDHQQGYRLFSKLARFWPALLACPVFACSCTGGHTPCGEITLGSAVFTGTVVSVSPAFLNRLNPASRVDADRVSQFYNQLASGAQTQGISQLKQTFRSLLPALPPDLAARLNTANSPQKLLDLFETVLDHGSDVTFEIRTVFAKGGDDDANDKTGDDDQKTGNDTSDTAKGKDPKVEKKNKPGSRDDDDHDDNDAPAPGKLFSLSTPFGDCGVEFQTGETYLVYASMDEDTNSVETDVCMGTRRLSDAGADLPYLSFYKDNPKEAGHLDGFVTSDSRAQANPPPGDTIPSPIGDILIELESDGAIRYTTADRDGKFVFDGLADDKYKITGYAAPYPDTRRIVAGPDELRIKPKACSRHVLLFRKR